jgi:hypothetical protein
MTTGKNKNLETQPSEERYTKANGEYQILIKRSVCRRTEKNGEGFVMKHPILVYSVMDDGND